MFVSRKKYEAVVAELEAAFAQSRKALDRSFQLITERHEWRTRALDAEAQLAAMKARNAERTAKGNRTRALRKAAA